ncbi:MAG: glycosyltransferase family 1 protein [Psychrobacter sp.]|nr:glycosyltransferase family 1 protein [Psychrobacter sp.]
MILDNIATREYFSAPSVVFDSCLYVVNSDKTLVIDKPKSWQLSNQITSDKLHILLVTETWWPDVNGVAMSLQRIMKQTAGLGHKISLVRPKPMSDQALGNRSGVHNLATAQSFVMNDIQVKGMSIPKYSSLQFGLPSYFKVKRELEAIRPDIVHIATEGPLGLAALMAAKSLKIPATTGYHTQFHDFSKHFGLGCLARPMMAYFKWFHNASKATCVPSKKTFNDLKKIGFKRLYEVGRGVDLAQFNSAHRSDELREQWGAQQHHTVLVMVSRLSPEKDIDLVIKSFRTLQHTQLQRALKLVIVGDGPDRARLEVSAKESSNDIIFAGTQTGRDLSQHYASADAFVFASQVETFGNVVIEAMATGLPVYAFDDAAAGMLVTEDTGRLATLGNKQEFIDLVANLPEMQQLKQQGQQAASSVSGFSWQRPANQMLTMFYNAIGKQKMSPSEMQDQVVLRNQNL